jgi:hypothetical protein
MIVRQLHQRIRPERFGDWLLFTRDVGFPGMLAQPGCRAIRRLAVLGSRSDPDGAVAVCIETDWDSLSDLERFRASEAMRTLTEAGRGLSIPPSGESLFEVLPDPGI